MGGEEEDGEDGEEEGEGVEGKHVCLLVEREVEVEVEMKQFAVASCN